MLSEFEVLLHAVNLCVTEVRNDVESLNNDWRRGLIDVCINYDCECLARDYAIHTRRVPNEAKGGAHVGTLSEGNRLSGTDADQ